MSISLTQEPGGAISTAASFPILFIALMLTVLILWRRYRSRRRLLEKISELEDLSTAGRAIAASELNIYALCQLIADQAASIIDTSTFQIGIFEDDFYEILYWTVSSSPKDTPQAFDLSDQPGLVGWVRDNKRSMLIQNFEKQRASLPAEPSYSSDEPPKSAIFIPLVSGAEAIGLIAAQSHLAGAFSQRDLGRLTILANQAAAAIANARMYEQARLRAAQMELVGDIAQRVNAISDLDELLTSVVMLTRDTFNFKSVNIFGTNPASEQVVVQASSIPILKPGMIQLESGQGLVGTAMATKKTTLSNNTIDDDRFLRDEWSEDTRSEIAIPLIVEDELLGVLDVQSRSLGAFTQQEQTVLGALGAQVAIAIHKAHQFSRQRRQSWITTAQLQVAETISQSAELGSLTSSIIRLTRLLTGVESCILLLWDDELETFEVAAEYGLSADSRQRLHEFPLKIGSWSALDAVYVGQERLTTTQAPPWISEAEEWQGLLLPLVAKGRTLGIMAVSKGKGTGEFADENPEELLRNIAAQTAQAIDSMKLQVAQQEEAWVNTALLQVAEAVNHLTDLNEILDTIVRMVPLLVGVRSCIILVWDEENDAFQAGPSYGLSEMGHGLLESFDVNLSEFPLLDKQDMDRIGPDATFYTFQLPEWMTVIMESETANLVPLYARAKLVGAMVVGPSTSNRPLVGRRLNIVSGIAQQAAVAVVNHQLYKESAEKSRMEQELDVAYSIQASLIPDGRPDIPGCSICSYWEAARQVSGDFYDFLPLRGDHWGIAIADVADKGIPAALFMALSRTILRTVAFNRESPAAVLQRTNQLIYNDTSSDLFVTVFYAVWNPTKASLTFANGGHNPPILIRANGETSLLTADGIAVGVLEEISLAQRSVHLQDGDVIILYTDGVTEAMNEDYDEFGLDRLCQVGRDTRRQSAEDIVNAIKDAIDTHAGGMPQFDDITMIVLKK